MLLNANNFLCSLIMYMNKLESWTSGTTLEISYLRSDFLHRVLQRTILYTLITIGSYLYCRVLVNDSSPLFVL